jgi:shikimate dehydrogenase
MPTTRSEHPRPTGLSAATTVVGVIGDPVAHSLSPLLHNTAFAALGLDWVSVGFRVPAGAGADALVGARALGLRGLSVTMPHKDAVADLVDALSPLAARLGAVNCVVEGDDGSYGDNTDGPGLVAALRHGDRFDPTGQRCLVIGAGGAARAVVAALAEAGATEVVVVNRTPARAASAAALAGPAGTVGSPADVARCQLVVNATPLGMGSPGGGASGAGGGGAGGGGPAGATAAAWPLDPARLIQGQTVVDLVYHPRTTPWMEAARQRGAVVSNGLGMLVHQAALQLAAWTGLDPPVDAMWRAATGSEPTR